MTKLMLLKTISMGPAVIVTFSSVNPLCCHNLPDRLPNVLKFVFYSPTVAAML